MRRLGVAVVGAGSIASAHLDAYAAEPEAEVVAVVDRHPERGAALQKVGGHGVPQPVGPQVRRAVDQPQGAVHDPADHPHVDPPAALAEEDRGTRRRSRECRAALVPPPS